MHGFNYEDRDLLIGGTLLTSIGAAFLIAASNITAVVAQESYEYFTGEEIRVSRVLTSAVVLGALVAESTLSMRKRERQRGRAFTEHLAEQAEADSADQERKE